MAVSRATSLRALTKLTATSTSRHTRTLHMTGPTSVSPILTTTNPSRAAVKTAIDDAKSSHARSEIQPSTRQFNTSRSLKAVNDSSTIDFAYLPDFDPDTKSAPAAVRVPLLPSTLYPGSTKTRYSKEEEEIVMKPEINLISADANVSVFSEVTDNLSFEGVNNAVQGASKKAGEEVGELRKIWSGFIDDVLGVKTKHA